MSLFSYPFVIFGDLWILGHGNRRHIPAVTLISQRIYDHELWIVSDDYARYKLCLWILFSRISVVKILSYEYKGSRLKSQVV